MSAATIRRPPAPPSAAGGMVSRSIGCCCRNITPRPSCCRLFSRTSPLFVGSAVEAIRNTISFSLPLPLLFHRILICKLERKILLLLLEQLRMQLDFSFQSRMKREVSYLQTHNHKH